ncbi:hypothetical protein [Sphingobacterium hotanense]|uniref:DUF8192 domain-containing protein n=1 Tax=Sphingobacterium hotanense TaxID=649196 RepID=A0ABT7NIE8_9SPHI|nr:hypothetical protein [Sphingobacterium hotanense]MDM1046976.1 hypothetical protein [Sphingobacterium hotanense]
MKNRIIISLGSMFVAIILYGQERNIETVPKNILECIHETGKDSSTQLNPCESSYLDYFFEKQRGLFSFKDKDVSFFTGNMGTVKSNKKEFFESVKQSYGIGLFPSLATSQLLIFDEVERKNIGYDAVIITGSKKYITKKNAVKYINKL